MNNKRYEFYKTQRDIEEGLKILKEGYTFNEAPADVPADNEADIAAAADEADFLNKGEFRTDDGTIAELRKLVFKALGECQDDITSPKYNTMKKIWNLLDGLAVQKDVDSNKE